MALSKELLEILVCPACKGELEWREPASRLICHHCRLAYRVEDDIPIMLVDKAESLTPATS
ncbi:MAG: Trm112 family protein [Chloroflexi bacterium]|nr:Trm112 family protein [Chloroflexota bacterium]